MERSASDEGASLIPLMVKATSSAVSASPSVNFASVRILNVHTMPSSLHSYDVARSLCRPMSASVLISVDWINGSCTCSPHPHETKGSNPASGSALVGMETMTWFFG